MKSKYLVLLLSVLVLVSCGKKEVKKSDLKDDKSKQSYAVGYNIGSDFGNKEIEIDYDAFLKGVQDGVNGDTLLSQTEIRDALMSLQKQITEKMNAKKSEQGSKNKEEGAAFLEKNKNEEGVNVTESGLQYKVLKEGNGKAPKATDKVKVHYEGKLLDGTIFDSSYKRGQPAEFQLNQVIKGWTEGLQLMKEGAIYELYIPSELAYGPNGAGAQIGPNATLVFKVELIEIQ